MKYKSDIFEMIHEDATEMFTIGAISEARMQEYDEMCLVPEESPSVRQQVQNGETACKTNTDVESSVRATEHITA